MNHSIPNATQNPIKCGDNLVTHATHPSEAHNHDLVRFTIGCNFFSRSSSVVDLNGKGKLGGEKDASSKECANSIPDKGWRTILQSKKKLMSKPAQVKEE